MRVGRDAVDQFDAVSALRVQCIIRCDALLFETKPHVIHYVRGQSQRTSSRVVLIPEPFPHPHQRIGFGGLLARCGGAEQLLAGVLRLVGDGIADQAGVALADRLDGRLRVGEALRGRGCLIGRGSEFSDPVRRVRQRRAERRALVVGQPVGDQNVVEPVGHATAPARLDSGRKRGGKQCRRSKRGRGRPDCRRRSERAGDAATCPDRRQQRSHDRQRRTDRRQSDRQPADGADERDGVGVDAGDGAGDGRQPGGKRPDAVDGAGDVLAQQIERAPGALDGGAQPLDARQVRAAEQAAERSRNRLHAVAEAAQVGAVQRGRQVAGDGFEDGLHAPESGFEVVDQWLEVAAVGAAADGAHDCRQRSDDAARLVEQAVADAGQADLDRVLQLLRRWPERAGEPGERGLRGAGGRLHAGKLGRELAGVRASEAEHGGQRLGAAEQFRHLLDVAAGGALHVVQHRGEPARFQRLRVELNAELLRERRGLTRRIDDRRQRAAQVGNGFGRLDTLLRQHGQRGAERFDGHAGRRSERRDAAEVVCQIADLDRAVADGAEKHVADALHLIDAEPVGVERADQQARGLAELRLPGDRALLGHAQQRERVLPAHAGADRIAERLRDLL